MKKIICFFFGHKKVKGLFEDEESITNAGCSRCGCLMNWFGSHQKKFSRSTPCPGKSQEYWNKWCDEFEAELRIKYSHP